MMNEKDTTDSRSLVEKKYKGSISLRVPKSLHRPLVEEANTEGVSLNQLILTKISVLLIDIIKGRK
jgi:predicted HicB family RNase H-like nuclease